MSVDLNNYFYPSSICIAGASSKEKSIGYELLKSIKNYNYRGSIFPVNPKGGEILGYKVFKSIDEIEAGIDLAIVVVPKAFVEETIERLLNRDVKSIILITAGFREVGEEGAKNERRILNKVREAGARLVGPNCMGIITTFGDIKLNATFVAEKPEVGKTAFLSQSGAIGAAVLNSLRETDIRFGHFISVGNKADINENDLLRYWNEDERIQTVTMYLESFEEGEKFIKQFITGEIKKPVIILKGGRTSSGMKAASSHTGALGSNDKVVNSVLNQFGIIRAAALDELFNTAKGFENFPVPEGKRIAVVTNAGGPAILTVDALAANGLELASLTEETKNKLREIVHPEGSVNNPIDLLPGGTADQFKLVNEIAAADENVDAVVSVFVEPVMVPAFEVIEKINSINSVKPVFQVVMPLPEFWEKYRKESQYKKPLFRKPEEPGAVISNMLFHKSKRVKKTYLKQRIAGLDLSGERGFLSQRMIDTIVERYELPAVKTQIVKRENINSNDNEFTYPLVIKGLARDVVHKSEFNAVKLNIKNKEELLKAEMEILNGFNKKNVHLEEFLIQPYIKTKHEVLIGGFRDPVFGPMIMFGTGGKYVEVYDDTAIKSAYISEEDIYEMISRTKMGKILSGVRGDAPADIEKLAGIIKTSAQLMLDISTISEFDFNPLIVSDTGNFYIVDIRIKAGQ